MNDGDPDRAAVLSVLAEMRERAQSTRTKVSVLAVARRLGMANTTFRRRFPDLVEQITADVSPRASVSGSASIDTESKLRQRNRDLSQNLELAVGVIQRLTLENQRLREELEAAQAVTQLRPRRSTVGRERRRSMIEPPDRNGRESDE